MRVLLVVAYEGTEYAGWQIQNNLNTVEARLNKAISELTGEPTEVIGASRTDSGVHSQGNLAVFDTKSRIPADKFSYALNRRLPEDIVIRESYEVPEDFHPRHINSQKTYEYKIYNDIHPNPLLRRTTHFVHHILDVDRMRQAASYLTGEHDFKSFASIHMQAKTSIRTIYSAEVEKSEDGHLITIRVKGNGFLYNMVRIIAGTLIDVGQGLRTPESVRDALEKCDRSFAGPTAPAKGLTLVKIDFDINKEAVQNAD